MKYKVPFIKPAFPDAVEIAADYEKIVSSNRFTNFGPFERRLCRDIESFVGQQVNVTTVANATLGIEIAIRGLLKIEYEAKNEVIMPSFTFAAGAEVLIGAGYKPIFIDIDEQSWQPNIRQAERYIESNQSTVRGILLCNVFGVGNSEVRDWENLAEAYGLPLIIDSAAGFGSEYDDGSRLGARGDCEIFSMHATKPFSVGEGGLIISRDKDFIEQARSLQNFGFINYQIQGIGTNAKLSEIHCAIGCRQLRKLESRLRRRREILSIYKDKLSGLGVEYQENDSRSTVPFLSVVFDSKDKAQRVKTLLTKKGVEARSYYSPLHLQPYLKGRVGVVGKLPVTESIAESIVSLPVHDDMSIDLIERVTNIINSVE